jgi:hypothetical protein
MEACVGYSLTVIQLVDRLDRGQVLIDYNRSSFFLRLEREVLFNILNCPGGFIGGASPVYIPEYNSQ